MAFSNILNISIGNKFEIDVLNHYKEIHIIHEGKENIIFTDYKYICDEKNTIFANYKYLCDAKETIHTIVNYNGKQELKFLVNNGIITKITLEFIFKVQAHKRIINKVYLCSFKELMFKKSLKK